MENNNKSTVFYSLNEEDIQNVALQEIERKLSEPEIESIKELIASNINWFDAIAKAIYEKIKTEEHLAK
jgi:hypothetical protein